MNDMYRPEHPKPQMLRQSWKNLNGVWDFAFDNADSGLEREFWTDGQYTHQINVPFCPESSLSNIGHTDFMPAVWYRRIFNLEPAQLGGRVLLHFGAADYEAIVWVNGLEVGRHRGGYASFCFEITGHVQSGVNTLVVCVRDDVRGGRQPAGKQSVKYGSYGCFYTRTTGIWQTVWLEFTPVSYIKNLRLTPDPENARLHGECELVSAGGGLLTVKALYEGREVGLASVNTLEHLAVFDLALSETHLWQPGSPCLYDLHLTLEKDGERDTVQSYFGMRSLEWKNHALYINGRPVFQRLVLDQGFFPDGIYTAPSDQALQHDIKLAMELGFNGARLHEKVFEERYLYHADRMGYLVWGEMANWSLDITTPAGLTHFLPEWLEVMRRDYNHPSLVGWCPFNETWDQNGARQHDPVLSLVWLATKAVDSTRPVIDTSGNFHVVTDIYDVHDYEQDSAVFAERYGGRSPGGAFHEHFPYRQQYDGKAPFFVSEFGGARWAPGGNDKESWGYGNAPKTESEFAERYERLTAVLLQSEGVCAFCYTQLTDVEQEQNGLYTYDRRPKFNTDVYARLRNSNLQKARVEGNE